MNAIHKIKTDPCGCDRPEHLKSLISFDEALRRIAAIPAIAHETECLPLHQATGRILAEAVIAQSNTPPFDNAAMDGYAINTDGLTGEGPRIVPVAGRVPAGQASNTDLQVDQAMRIFTGAPVPKGADAVVMQEDVHKAGNAIVISRRPRKGAHIRRAGEDMSKGDRVVESGRPLDARAIAACAAAGCGQVDLFRKLRVGLLITGDEVQTAGEYREEAAIWDVNTPMLQSALTSPDIELIEVTHGFDSRFALKSQLSELAGKTDLLITTGGISVGEEDHVKPAMKSLGADLLFSGVALKPGKPVTVGRLGQCTWLGLPGNPLSAYVTWLAFGTVLRKRLSGQQVSLSPHQIVVTGQDIQRKPGRTELRPARIADIDSEGRPIVEFENATHSGRVANLHLSDGLMILPAETAILPAGALVEFQPFSKC